MDNKEKNKNRPFFLYAALGLLIFLGVQQYNENVNAPESVSFSEFKLLITENKVNEAGMTEEAEKKVNAELSKLKMMSPMSAEASVVRSYIDCLVAVPWKKRSKIRHDLIRAENKTTGARGKNFKGVGRWNNARIIVNGGKVEHWLNHVKVVEFDRFSQTFEALVEKSKYEIWEHFGRWPEGVILLQDHGDKVSFKNIKVREF